MTDTLKKLRAAVEAMHPGRWFSQETPAGKLEILTDTGDGTFDLIEDAFADDAAGIVALRNAALALLDLADAVARWSETECSHLLCQGAAHRPDCHVGVALQAVLDASKKLEAL